MRQVTRYPASLKESLLAKMLAPNGATAVQLSKEFNIPYGTLKTWLKMSKQYTVKQVQTPQRPNNKSPLAKLQAVIETNGKTEQEIGVYCREQGIYPVHLDEWKKQFLENFNPVINKKDKVEHQQAAKEINQLKIELRRKDKALAEVSALLILKKKANLLWGINEDA